jgi:hypothetical protein
MPSIDQARTWYDERDPVHGFDHVLRVLRLAEDLGRQLGADLEAVVRDRANDLGLWITVPMVPLRA